MRDFVGQGRPTIVAETRASDGGPAVPMFVNEFWTAKQRAAHSLHEVSYRACFKPQLPRFFIERLTEPGDVVHDPFLGRGTTALEAALLGRVPTGCDVNPLSRILVEPRFDPPTPEAIAVRLAEMDRQTEAAARAIGSSEVPDDLLAFFHPDTLAEIAAMRRYFRARLAAGTFDSLDGWIRMVAVNRLTGHSPGFFSVYTMPPNQAVSVESQRKINARRGDAIPPRRDVAELILRKSRSLLTDCSAATCERLSQVGPAARILTSAGHATHELEAGSVALVVTSPPFLQVVQYKADNWLRCWFCEIDPDGVAITHLRRVDHWRAAMTEVMCELRRLLRPGGRVAFEVGEVQKGQVLLEQEALAAGIAAGLEPELVVIHDQTFTKTANCWGVANNQKGTNSNRIVVLRK